MNYLVLVFLLIATFNFSFAKQSDANDIASMTKEKLFELDTKGITTILNPYLKSKPYIQKLLITDSITGDVFFTFEKNPSQLANSSKIECLKSEKKFISSIKYDDEIIGELLLCTNEITTALNLSKKEIEWLEKHPVIKVHNEKTWAPINFNRYGVASGFSIDYMNLLAQKIGIKVEYLTDEWSNLYNMGKNKKLDVMLNIAKTKEREKFFLFTPAYQKNSVGIFGRSDDKSISSLDTLNGKKVAIADGFYHEGLIKEEFPLIQIITVKNSEEAIKKICKKEADATIGSFIVNTHAIHKSNCQNIEFKRLFEVEKDIDLHIAVRNDYTELHSIIQKAMASVGSIEMNKIRQKWIIQESKDKIFNLTKEEKEWIKRHSTVIVGADNSWAPFSFINEDGDFKGLARDYLDLIAEISGLNFEIRPNTWNNILTALKEKKIDLVPTIYYSNERTKFTHFTNAYLRLSNYYITRDDYKTVNNIRELYGKKIVAIKGYAVTSWIKENHPEIKIHEVDSILEALNILKIREVDVFINDNPSTTYVMKNNFISGLKFNNILREKSPEQVRISVNYDNKPLSSIINKAIKAIPPHEIKNIRNKWMQSINLKSIQVEFEANEIEWINNKPVIKFAVDPKWLPIEGINNDTKSYEGMMAEYLEKIAQLTGIKFELVPTKKWSDSVSLSKSKEVDMLAAVSITPDREKYLNFSRTTFTLNDGVIMKSDAKFISNIKELQGLKVGVPSGTALHKMIETNYPELNIIPIKGTENGIEKLNSDEIDAYIGNLEVISYLIFQKSLLNIKVVLKLDTSRNLHIAVQKSYPNEALSVINKAIAAITNEEKNLIRQKWIGLKINEGIDYTLFIKIALGVVCVIIFFIYNNQKLQRMVQVRTEEISKQKDELENFSKNLEKLVEERTLELKEMHKHTQDSIEYASLIQHALIPEKELFERYFDDFFTMWQPKDIVGGDIYLFEHLRSDDECLLMVIDCTGHGVPGAFVTMLVKAIERQVIAKIINDENLEVSPAWILAYFNKSMKKLLKQESLDSVSNAGFDGGILYYNKKNETIKYAGAETPLFYYDENNELQMIKSDRHSIGYKKSDINFKFKEYEIKVKKGMRFYISTDGYLDQNGGEKGFPLGKRKFKNLLEENHTKTFEEQKTILMNTIVEYQNGYERNDDITVIGLKT